MMATDEELLLMPENEYKIYVNQEKQKEKQKHKEFAKFSKSKAKEEINYKKRILKQKIKQLKISKSKELKTAQLNKRRFQAIKAQLKPLEKSYSAIGQESGYFKNKPEQKKTKYLGFI